MLNIASVIKKRSQSISSAMLSLKIILDKLDFLQKTVTSQWNIKNKYLQILAKLTESIPDPSSCQECYNSYLENKSIKSVKQSKIISQRLKAIENPNIVDVKLAILEHPKPSYK